MDVNTVVLTSPVGSKTIGEVEIGDYLLGPDGKPVRVLAIGNPVQGPMVRIKYRQSLGRNAPGEYGFSCVQDHKLHVVATIPDTGYTGNKKPAANQQSRFFWRHFVKTNHQSGEPTCQCGQCELFMSQTRWFQTEEVRDAAMRASLNPITPPPGMIYKGDQFDVRAACWNVIPNGMRAYYMKLQRGALPPLTVTDKTSTFIDPLWFGHWLGDGSENSVSISVGEDDEAWVGSWLAELVSRDPDVHVKVSKRVTMEIGMPMPPLLQNIPGVVKLVEKRVYLYSVIRSDLVAHPREHPWRLEIRSEAFNGVFYDKSKGIPDCFRLGTREIRLKVLAGLINSDGNCEPVNQRYEISQYTERHRLLLVQAFEMAKSVGLECPSIATIAKDAQHPSVGWKFAMVGPVIADLQPYLLPRKQMTFSSENYTDRREHKKIVSATVMNGTYRSISVQGGKYQLGDRVIVNHHPRRWASDDVVPDSDPGSPLWSSSPSARSLENASGRNDFEIPQANVPKSPSPATTQSLENASGQNDFEIPQANVPKSPSPATTQSLENASGQNDFEIPQANVPESPSPAPTQSLENASSQKDLEMPKANVPTTPLPSLTQILEETNEEDDLEAQQASISTSYSSPPTQNLEEIYEEPDNLEAQQASILADPSDIRRTPHMLKRVASSEEILEEQLRREDGLLYVFRGRRVFRKYAANIDQNPVVEPRLLFPKPAIDGSRRSPSANHIDNIRTASGAQNACSAENINNFEDIDDHLGIDNFEGIRYLIGFGGFEGVDDFEGADDFEGIDDY